MAPMSDDDQSAPSLEALEREVEVQVFASSGPGGQHRNRKYTAVRLVHPPTGLTVTCADTRSQHRNRRIALERLQRRIADLKKRKKRRKRTRKPRSVRRREVEEKRRRGRKKKLRRSPPVDDDR